MWFYSGHFVSIRNLSKKYDLNNNWTAETECISADWTQYDRVSESCIFNNLECYQQQRCLFLTAASHYQKYWASTLNSQRGSMFLRLLAGFVTQVIFRRSGRWFLDDYATWKSFQIKSTFCAFRAGIEKYAVSFFVNMTLDKLSNFYLFIF